MATMKILLRPDIRQLSCVRQLQTKPKFGFIFDIDGVIVRGKSVLPPVREAFKRLQGKDGKFRVPTVFVTNSGNALRSEKAADLTNWIGLKVTEDQVVMAHSPLVLVKKFHEKQVLVSGQGPVRKIAKELGFKKTVTISDIVKNYPSLDYVNKDRRNPQCGPIDKNFPMIEGILLLSEPISWETPLQLMVDLLMTNGIPSSLSPSIPYPHIPVLACNMDLLWVSEAPIPRYGHGAFLVCLEALYKKVTGQDMKYSALVGKPSEITYYHANHMLTTHARELGITHNIDTIYAIGDNINTDIFGANLWDKYLARHPKNKGTKSRSMEAFLGANLQSLTPKACISILVETGVHNRDSQFSPEHNPRDFLAMEQGLCKPAFIVGDVGCAIDLVLKEEKLN